MQDTPHCNKISKRYPSRIDWHTQVRGIKKLVVEAMKRTEPTQSTRFNFQSNSSAWKKEKVTPINCKLIHKIHLCGSLVWLDISTVVQTSHPRSILRKRTTNGRLWSWSNGPHTADNTKTLPPKSHGHKVRPTITTTNALNRRKNFGHRSKLGTKHEKS